MENVPFFIYALSCTFRKYSVISERMSSLISALLSLTTEMMQP
jgi:hypothetical protein